MMRATVVSSLLTGYYGIIMIFENVDVNNVNINQSFSLSLALSYYNIRMPTLDFIITFLLTTFEDIIDPNPQILH